MKKILLTLLFLVFSTILYSQTLRYEYNSRYIGYVRSDNGIGINVVPTNLIDVYSGSYKFRVYTNKVYCR